jgi:hypothetical protein
MKKLQLLPFPPKLHQTSSNDNKSNSQINLNDIKIVVVATNK